MAEPKVFKNEKYEIKASCVTAVITLFDTSFSVYAEALEALNREFTFESNKIFFMQSIEKKGEPLRIVVVFEF